MIVVKERAGDLYGETSQTARQILRQYRPSREHSQVFESHEFTEHSVIASESSGDNSLYLNIQT